MRSYKYFVAFICGQKIIINNYKNNNLIKQTLKNESKIFTKQKPPLLQHGNMVQRQRQHRHQ